MGIFLLKYDQGQSFLSSTMKNRFLADIQYTYSDAYVSFLLIFFLIRSIWVPNNRLHRFHFFIPLKYGLCPTKKKQNSLDKDFHKIKNTCIIFNVNENYICSWLGHLMHCKNLFLHKYAIIEYNNAIKTYILSI